MFDQRGSAAFRSTPAAAGVQQNLRKTLFKCCLLVATFTRVWPCCSYYVLATYIYCRLILLWKNYLMEFTPPVTVYIHSLFQLLYHLFLSQTADPPLSKATKVARLQLAYKPGSSSSQRDLLLSALSYASPTSVISHFPFPFRSWFNQFPFKNGEQPNKNTKLFLIFPLIHSLIF